MSTLAPTWALGAQAIPSGGDPHLATGVHLRLFVHPTLGLPICPFQVYRINLGSAPTGGAMRNDSVIWTDSSGAGGMTLKPPFDASKGNALTAWLPAQYVGVCSWLEVLVTPDNPPLPVPKFTSDSPSTVAAGDTSDGTSSFVGIADFDMRAMVQTATGPGVVSTAKKRPWQMSASRIDRVRVLGEGNILGVNWLDSKRLVSNITASPWRMWSLPVPSGPAYANVGTFAADSDARVSRGAPRRYAMYDQVDSDPNTAGGPLNPGSFELTRMATLSADAKRWVSAVVNCASGNPSEVTEGQEINDGIKNVGQATLNCASSAISSCMDASMARCLGFADLDDQPPGDGTSVIAYVIRGIWQLNFSPVSKDADLLATIPQSAYVQSLASVLPAGVTPHARQQAPFLDMCTVAVVSRAQFGEKPAPPLVKSVVTGPWQALTPPAAEREMVVRLGGLSGASAVAMVRCEGTKRLRLNPPLAANTGLGMPLIPSRPKNASEPGLSDFFDRHATTAVTAYRFAQCDAFGRWSDWTEVPASIGDRPKPPRPTLILDYTQPPPSMNSAVVPLSGKILVKVPIPKPDTLPPGSLPLASLELEIAGNTITKPLPTTLPADNHLQVTVDGPAIARAGQTTVTVVGRWINTAGVKSADSETMTRKLWDPRPGEPVDIPSFVQYGSRPDITGRSRMELRWTRIGAQKRFRVFYADETALIGALEQISKQQTALADKIRAQSILSILATKKDLLDRAVVLRDNRDFLKRDMFDLVTGTPIEANEDGSVSFVHEVSGSLRVLSFFRIVSVTEANAESDFLNSLLVPYAVPNSPRPAQPLVDVQQIVDTATTSLLKSRSLTSTDILPPQPIGEPQVFVSIRVPGGTAQAAAYRLRRSSSSAADPIRMPVVRTGVMPQPLNGDMQHVSVMDTNADALPGAPGKLRFWNTYLWRAETRAAAEVGQNGPEGEWSPVSTPVSLTLIPPNPPAPVSTITASIDLKTRKVILNCTHSQILNGGATGHYKLDVYRQKPGEREKYLKSVFADAPPEKGGQDANGRMQIMETELVPRGTTYRVVVVDPMGRTSLPSTTVQV